MIATHFNQKLPHPVDLFFHTPLYLTSAFPATVSAIFAQIGLERKTDTEFSGPLSILKLSSTHLKSSLYKSIENLLLSLHFDLSLGLRTTELLAFIPAITVALIEESVYALIDFFLYWIPAKAPSIEDRSTLPHLGESFMKGVATCTYQDTGGFEHSQWHKWEQRVISDPMNRSDHGVRLLDLYETAPDQVISALKTLRVNTYRFSVEWSEIEPSEGKLKPEKLTVYKNFCAALKEHSIRPILTLHHFSEPVWFFESGSFENLKNQEAFARFCEFVAEEMGDLVQNYCTINEPAIEAFSRFIRGAFAPGEFLNFERAYLFLKGAYQAHQLAYRALKNLNPKNQVGLTHQYLRMIPGNVFLVPICDAITRLTNQLFFSLVYTGEIELKIPFFINKRERIEFETDFIGVQYYARPIIGLFGSVAKTFYEPMTLMPFREDPEGLSEAILVTHQRSKKPILVTENGISTEDPEQRKRYYQRALSAFYKARDLLKKSLLGYCAWALPENSEWDMGRKPQNFSIYSIKTGSPRPGIEPFIDFA